LRYWLEVAVKAALKHKTGIWFGWSGKVVPHGKIATQTVAHDKITYITLDQARRRAPLHFSREWRLYSRPRRAVPIAVLSATRLAFIK
jgi:hypothetical protein